ncbi:hypothetical protein A2635_05085 [Candidatus Peribacteria bacterium RIFCSPHIGHO2_01_FULL_51_9]|nr:MAG: hypothetical protein A2635_05085 [Candidatus Peribacteria bacterium RIFCSPHIGHO2_01_FULL_51_9]
MLLRPLYLWTKRRDPMAKRKKSKSGSSGRNARSEKKGQKKPEAAQASSAPQPPKGGGPGCSAPSLTPPQKW